MARSRLEVECGVDSHHAGHAVDGEAPTGIVVEGVGDSIGRGVGIRRKRGDADDGAVGRVLIDGVGRRIAVHRRGHGKFVHVGDTDTDGLAVAVASTIADLYDHFVGVVAVRIRWCFAVGCSNERQGTSRGVNRKQAGIHTAGNAVGCRRTIDVATGHHGHGGRVLGYGQRCRPSATIAGNDGRIVDRGVVDGRRQGVGVGRAVIDRHREGRRHFVAVVHELDQAASEIGTAEAGDGSTGGGAQLEVAASDAAHRVGEARAIRVGNTEVGTTQRDHLPFADRQAGAVEHRRIVDRSDIDGDGIRGRIEIDPAVSRAAIVLHLECETGVTGAEGIGGRGKTQQACVDIRDADFLARRHGDTVQAQAAGAGQRRDPHRKKRIRRAVARVAETEVRRREDVGRVFWRRHRIVRARRCGVDFMHRDADGFAVGCSAVADDDVKAVDACTLGLRRRPAEHAGAGVDGCPDRCATKAERERVGRDIRVAGRGGERERRPLVDALVANRRKHGCVIGVYHGDVELVLDECAGAIGGAHGQGVDADVAIGRGA